MHRQCFEIPLAVEEKRLRISARLFGISTESLKKRFSRVRAMKSHSNFSGRMPRTLEDAFGPYTSRDFNDPPELPWWYWAIFTVIVLIFLVILSAFK